MESPLPMSHPSNSILKTSLVMLSLTALLGNYDLGERTLNTDGAATQIIERKMVASDDRIDTLAGCIAQPSDWLEPANVAIAGTAQVDGSTQEFSSLPSRYTEGEATINGQNAIDTYTWYCYIDEARDYGYEADENWDVIYADGAKMSYTLTPEADNQTVFTTLGMIDGGWDRRETQYFYKELASHKIIANNAVASHFEKLSNGFSQTGYDPAADSFQIFEHQDSIFFVGYKGKALVSKMDGSYTLREVPTDSQIYLLNDRFIAFKEVYDDEIHEVTRTEIRHSTDMITWSDVIDASILNNVYSATLAYDPKNSLYVVLNTATTQGQDRVYFTSPDLINWTANTVGIWQNNMVVFAPDGRGVMGNLASIETLMSRTENGDWENVTDLPGTGAYRRYRDIIFANDRFHALVYEYDVIGEGDDRETVYHNLYVGYSDDLAQWTWTSISQNEDEILALSDLTSLADNQIAISGGSYSSSSLEHVYVSADNGGSWNKSTSLVAKLELLDAMDTSTRNYNINSLINHNGTTYGKLTVSMTDFSAAYYFSTTDFMNFNMEFTANDSELFTFNDALYLHGAPRRLSWDNYRKIDASEIEERALARANESSNSGFGGLGIFELFMALVLVLGCRVPRKTV